MTKLGGRRIGAALIVGLAVLARAGEPSFTELYRAAWRAETVARDLPEAIALYDRAATADPAQAARAWFRKAACLEALGRDEDAIAAYRAVEGASDGDPSLAEGARWRRRRLELERPAPPPSDVPTLSPPVRIEGRRWDLRVGAGPAFLLPRRTFTLNDATFASSGFAARSAAVEWSLSYRTAPWLAVGLEGVEFLAETTDLLAVDEVGVAQRTAFQSVENRASYVGPMLAASRRRGPWTSSFRAGFGSCVQRSRIEVRPLDGSPAQTLRGRTSDVALTFAVSLDRRFANRWRWGVGLRDFLVFLREYNDGRAPQDPRARAQIRHVILPLLRLTAEF